MPLGSVIAGNNWKVLDTIEISMLSCWAHEWTGVQVGNSHGQSRRIAFTDAQLFDHRVGAWRIAVVSNRRLHFRRARVGNFLTTNESYQLIDTKLPEVTNFWCMAAFSFSVKRIFIPDDFESSHLSMRLACQGLLCCGQDAGFDNRSLCGRLSLCSTHDACRHRTLRRAYVI